MSLENTSLMLPIEIWQDIINIVGDHGRALKDGVVRHDILSLQRTCRLFHAICTPMLYQNVYISGGKSGLKKYCEAITKLPQCNRQPSIFVVLDDPEHDEGRIWTQLASLVNFGNTKRAIFMMSEAPEGFSFINAEKLEDYIGDFPNGLYCEFSLFGSLKRMVILGGLLDLICERALWIPLLEELVIVIPIIPFSHTHIWTPDDSSQAVKQRLRVTCIFPRARTINDLHFNLIQRRQDWIQGFRHAGLTLYLINTDEPSSSVQLDEQLGSDTPFRATLMQMFLDGSIYDWCRDHARLCGQQTGLTIMPF